MQSTSSDSIQRENGTEQQARWFEDPDVLHARPARHDEDPDRDSAQERDRQRRAYSAHLAVVAGDSPEHTDAQPTSDEDEATKRRLYVLHQLMHRASYKAALRDVLTAGYTQLPPGKAELERDYEDMGALGRVPEPGEDQKTAKRRNREYCQNRVKEKSDLLRAGRKDLVPVTPGGRKWVDGEEVYYKATWDYAPLLAEAADAMELAAEDPEWATSDAWRDAADAAVSLVAGKRPARRQGEAKHPQRPDKHLVNLLGDFFGGVDACDFYLEDADDFLAKARRALELGLAARRANPEAKPKDIVERVEAECAVISTAHSDAPPDMGAGISPRLKTSNKGGGIDRAPDAGTAAVSSPLPQPSAAEDERAHAAGIADLAVDASIGVASIGATPPPDAGLHARRALAAMVAAGVGRVSITLIDDTKERPENKVAYAPPMPIEQFAELEHAWRERAWREGYSMCVKPSSAPRGFVNIDDVSPDQAARCRPLARMVIETSPARFQCRFEVTGVETERDRDVVRYAIERALGGEANLGGGGSFRYPGSPNNKRDRRLPDGTPPMVCADDGPGRDVTREELRAAGLYVNAPAPAHVVTPSGRTPRAWPSYEIELSRAPLVETGARKGKPDRNKADFRFACRCLRWGHAPDAVVGRIMEVSTKAAKRRNPGKYAGDTVERALAMVFGVGAGA